MADRHAEVRTDTRGRGIDASDAVRAQACVPDSAPAAVGPVARVAVARGDAPARRCSPWSVL